MSITMQWHDQEHTIIYMLYAGQWTWEEYYTTAAAAKEKIREVAPQRVDIIAHMTGSFIPRGTSQIHGESVIKDAEPNMGFIVIVSTSYLVNMMMGISSKVSKAMRDKYRSVKSVADAETLIADSRRRQLYQSA